MSKVILMMSFIALSILLSFGLLSPTSPVMWLASTSMNFTLVRIGLLVMLMALLTTNPPRHSVLRVSVGILSIGLASWSLVSVFNNHMLLLDALVILQTSVTAALVVLERNTEQLKFHVNPAVQTRRISLTHSA